MKQYYKVSFKYSESVYCSNIAHAESREDVEAHYSRYEWVSVEEAAAYEVETAQRKGMPIVEVEHIEPAAEATEDTASALVERMTAKIEERKTRSAWDKGVKEYALELLEELREAVAGGYESLATLTNRKAVKKALLNGAADWSQYSWGGSALIYDGDIAERLCCPSELKKTRYGERRPNSREEWLDTQARALYQACRWVCGAFECVRWYDDNGEPLPRF